MDQSLIDDQPRQDALDQPGDVVIGFVRKSARMAIEIRLRTITKQRFLLARICRKDAAGVWHPIADNSRCGLSIKASVVSDFIDLLEKAEDRMADEGAIR